MYYIIAQILGFIAFFISLFAYHKKKKENILKSMIFSNFFNLIHYLFLGAISGCIIKIIAIIRDVFIILKKKYSFLSSYIFLAFFILIYIVIAIFTFKNILSLFPIFAATIYLIPVWNGNESTIRKTAFFTYFLWLFYNIFVLSIPGIISNILSIISTFIAIYNEKK